MTLSAILDALAKASDLERAILFALSIHAGQTDKVGQPYILHVLSVMLRLRDSGYDQTVQAVGVLHDVIEDTPATVDFVRASFGGEIADAVDVLTRRTGEPYGQYIERVRQHPTARIVKIADLNDNMDVRRWMWAESADAIGVLKSLRDRYKSALATLEGVHAIL